MTVKFRVKILLAALIVVALGRTPQVAADSPLEIPGYERQDVIYTVQPGDMLVTIALRYNLKLSEIVLANSLAVPGLIFPGQKLILPGVLASPSGAGGATLAASPSQARAMAPHVVQPGETISSIASQYGLPTDSLLQANTLINPDMLQVGQTIQVPAELQPTSSVLQAPFVAVEFSEATIIQGRTLVVYVTLSEPALLSGSFEGQPLFFTPRSGGQFWAITAIHALLGANAYPLLLTATLPDGRQVTHRATVTVSEGPYGQESIVVDSDRSALLNADLIARERETLRNLWSQVSPLPQWQGSFWYPVGLDDLRVTSYFGTRRTYNNSAELSFHSGTDFGGSGTPIYAPAAGTVVLAEPLTVRGNAVLVDHGLGLFSGYWHQSQIVVRVGQQLQPGDLIGYIGNTGLATGPHLHWELRLNGIAVDPLQWVNETIP